MIFLVVLVLASAGAALVAGRGDSWRDNLRRGLGIAMVFAGVSHWLMPEPFIQHLPEWVPVRAELIAFTGLVEVVLGATLFLRQPRWRQTAGLLLAAYLVSVFPSNVYVAVEGIKIDGQPDGVYQWLRLPFQALFIAIAVWSTRTVLRARESNPQARTPGHPSTRVLATSLEP